MFVLPDILVLLADLPAKTLLTVCKHREPWHGLDILSPSLLEWTTMFALLSSAVTIFYVMNYEA